MSLRFFADQCVPSEVSNFLSESGYDVVLLRDVLPIRSADPIVIEKAQQLRAILLSLNGDFSDIVAYPPRAFHGIVALQLHKSSGNHPGIASSSGSFFGVNLTRLITQANY